MDVRNPVSLMGSDESAPGTGVACGMDESVIGVPQGANISSLLSTSMNASLMVSRETLLLAGH